MKWLAIAAMVLPASTIGFAQDSRGLERRVQELEKAVKHLEARLDKLEKSSTRERRGMMDGGGMMGGERPNEQWRK